MKTTSLIRHPEKQRLVLLRETYLNICDNDHCQAALLAVVDYWTCKKLECVNKHEMNDVYFYNTLPELSEHLLGLYREEKVAESMERLVKRDFVLRRSNPKYRWDRTYQYRLNTPVVQAAIDVWAGGTDGQGVSPAIETPELRDGSRTSGAAIPETSTETSTQESTTVRPSAHGVDDLVEGPPSSQSSESPSAGRSATDQKANSWSTDALFEAVASEVFGMALPLDEISGARVGKIARWLRIQRITPEQMVLFVEWYVSEYPDLKPPRDATKFAEAWQMWRQAGVDQANAEAYPEQLDELDAQFMAREQERLLDELFQHEASGQ